MLFGLVVENYHAERHVGEVRSIQHGGNSRQSADSASKVRQTRSRGFGPHGQESGVEKAVWPNVHAGLRLYSTEYLGRCISVSLEPDDLRQPKLKTYSLFVVGFTK